MELRRDTIMPRFCIILFIGLITASCATPIKHTPLTATEFNKVDFKQLIPERWWGDILPDGIEDGIKSSAELVIARHSGSGVPTTNALVLSGGSANGAFGVGILAGWTESGDRPEFDYVTGISTGAMIAPLAFLGSDYDAALTDAYTSITQERVFRSKGLSGALWGSALADTAPLQELLEKYITVDVVRAIAAEQKRGRSLSVLTTHFDALRPTVWDITAIASNRGDAAAPLIRRIILASAAVPGLFPPVTIEWEHEGKSFTELHVDGAVTSQVFAYPQQIKMGELDKALGINLKRRVFVIQNGNSISFYKPAPVTTFSILRRAVSGLLLSQLNRDVERIYYVTQRDGIEFNTISIPDTYKADRSSEFDRDYMIELYNLGHATAKNGNFWQKKPRAEDVGDN